MTPTNSSVKPKRASAGCSAPTRISACTVVSTVPAASTPTARPPVGSVTRASPLVRRPEQIALRGEGVDQAAGVGADQDDRAPEAQAIERRRTAASRLP